MGEAGKAASVSTGPTPEKQAAARKLVEEGDRHLGAGDVDKALDCYERAITKDDGNALAYYGRGCVRAKQAEPPREGAEISSAALALALEDLDKAIELDGADARPYVRRAELRLMAGRARYDDPSTQDDANTDLSAALDDFRRAIELDPRDAGSYLGRGQVRQVYGDFTEACRDYEKALELDPNSSEARKRLQECREKADAPTRGDAPDAAGNEQGNAAGE